MKIEISDQKPAPRILEKTVLSVIGVLSLIFVPFCFLAVAAMLYGLFGSINPKYKLEIYYSLSFAALFSVLGVLLAVAGWRLIRSKQSQTEELITAFYPWFRRVGWLFVSSLALDGMLTVLQRSFGEGSRKIMAAIILLLITIRGHKVREYFKKE
jgi:hypothetical protein